MEERAAGFGQGPVLLRSMPKAVREGSIGDFRTFPPSQQNQALLSVESSLKPGNRLMTHEGVAIIPWKAYYYLDGMVGRVHRRIWDLVGRSHRSAAEQCGRLCTSPG